MGWLLLNEFLKCVSVRQTTGTLWIFTSATKLSKLFTKPQIFSKSKKSFLSFSSAEKKFEYLLKQSYSNHALALSLIISLLRPPINDTFDNATARLTAT